MNKAKSGAFAKDTQPIVVEKVYNAPVEKVWNAITDKSEMNSSFMERASKEKSFCIYVRS